MVASAWPGVVSSVAISTGVVITSRTGVSAGARPLSDRRLSTSRSVKIPATRLFSSITATAPTRRSSIVRIACSTVVSARTKAASPSHISRRFMPSPLRSKIVLEHLAILHHKTHMLENLDVRQRVARYSHYIRISAWRAHAAPSFHLQQFRGPRSCALNSLNRRHAKFHHAREFLRDRLRPRNSSHVGPKGNLHSRLQCLAKRLFVRRGALAVPLLCRRIGRCPVRVIHTQRRTKPRALLRHLRNLRIGQHQAVLDRIASPLERALHAFTAISVTGNFLSPAVGFVHDRAQFVQGQGRLRCQFSILADPRTVRHVYLDPIGAVVKLLARRLARFNRAVNDLYALRHV